MAKDLAAGIITDIDRQEKRPRLLVTLQDANKFLTVRYALSQSNITFPNGGTTYTAKNMEFTDIVQSAEGQVQGVTVRLDDTLRDIAAFIDSFKFKGGNIKIWRIYLDMTTGLAPASGTQYNEIFDGQLDTPGTINYNWATFPANIGKPLKIRALNQSFSRECDHVFGDSECNTDGNSNLDFVKGRATGGSSTTLVDAVNLWQKDDHWNSGQIIIIKGTSMFVASVTDFANGTVTFADIGTAVDTTCIYTISISSALMQMGTADSGTTSTFVDNALTQVDDFWNIGRVELTKAGVTYRRNVIDFDAGTDTVSLDVPLPVAIDNTTTYFLIKGCDKTWNTCQGNNAWGPESDNKANFLGFTHIGIRGSANVFSQPPPSNEVGQPTIPPGLPPGLRRPV